MNYVYIYISSLTITYIFVYELLSTSGYILKSPLGEFKKEEIIILNV